MVSNKTTEVRTIAPLSADNVVVLAFIVSDHHNGLIGS